MYDCHVKSQQPLYDLYKKYLPQIRRRKYTCVGLGIELVRKWQHLDKKFPGFATATALISCEEAVVDVRGYVTMGETPDSVGCAEKEHVLIGVQVIIDGRPGIMLADPGYHVGRIITVMSDRAYPHTGWFTKADDPQCRKEYEYSYNPHNSNYIEWHERETRGHIVKYQTSLIYAAQPYLDSIYVTEKRNLVYNFRSLLSRDPKGNLKAGMYFPVGRRIKEAAFTVFSDVGTEKRKTKYKFSAFTDPKNVDPSVVEEIERCSVQMRYKKRALLQVIAKLAKMMSNHTFINQLLDINDDICRMSL
ncbi:uncharacterized protein LOC113394799 [Vanessa tameamea]|uniref:Uncharacterized protein LOC113394799 n=1 Tax=Vanessa tameamea TaxID=334116 RepID=A0A8B8HT40_VANTA|nr:uncharacterized protein LOC113394799 [Vanessa tameamea]XP_047535378.1 uncharacterized protein LOC125069832 isoform X1 [Vanessa atalanta]